MLYGTCLLCFANNRRVSNIVNTNLQLLLEKFLNYKIENVLSYCLCFICHTRLQQSYQLWQLAKQSLSNLIAKTNEDLKPKKFLVELSISKVINISTSSKDKANIEPKVKEELLDENGTQNNDSEYEDEDIKIAAHEHVSVIESSPQSSVDDQINQSHFNETETYSKFAFESSFLTPVDKNNEDCDNNEDNNKSKTKHYREKDFCFFCEKCVFNFARHVYRHHMQEPEVQKIVSNPKKSVQRKRLLVELRKRGNFKNAKQRIKPMRRLEHTNYLPCVTCLGYYSKKLLWKHRRQCSGEKSAHAQSEAQNFPIRHLEIDDKLKNTVFPRMRADEISLVAKSDLLICTFGAQYLEAHRGKYYVNVVSRKMRELAILLLEIRKINVSVKSFFDVLKPVNYDQIVTATKVIGKYDHVKDTYQRPSFALNISTSLKQCCNIAIEFATKRPYKELNTHDIDTEIKALIGLIEKKWKLQISSQTATDLDQKNYNEATKDEINAIKLEPLDPLINIKSELPLTHPVKKRILTPWTAEQKEVVITYFKKHINDKQPPRRNECDNLKKMHGDLLKNKDWLKIKVFVQNMYTKK